MKLLKDYKGVLLIYVVLTIINAIWIVGYEKPSDVKQVSTEKNVVINT